MSLWDTLGFGKAADPAPQTVVVQQAPAAEQAPAEVAPLSTQGAWFTPAETDAKPVELDTSKLFTTDPAQLAAAIGNIDFTQGAVTPELAAAIEAGGPGATQALVAIMQKSTQQVMHASMQATAKMVEGAMAKAAPVMDQKMAAQMRSREVESAIRESNPVFGTEGGKMMLISMRDAMLAKFPNATSAEIADNAKSFIAELVKVGGPQEAKQDPNKDIMGTDWGTFLTP